MIKDELIELVTQLKHHPNKTKDIKIITAHEGCPTRLYDTLSSFSNQDDGGILLFGIEEKKDFAVVGVYDANDLQKKVTEQCLQMEPIVRPLFTFCDIDSKIVVSAEIPGIDYALRPAFYKGAGRLKGSFVRIGDADEPMTEYEIYSYDAFRKRTRDDLRIVENAKLSLFDENLLNSYLTNVKSGKNNLVENLSQDEIFEFMGITNEKKPTIASVLTFSKYPQAYFPQLCITAVSLPGTSMGELGEEGERFIDNQRINGNIPTMLESAVEFVQRNSRVKTIIDENGQRKDKPEYPLKAVREAILNALIHRDYSPHSENIPITIEMYRDRLEIRNPGGLYGRLTVDLLGKVRPETRNPALATMLEVLHVTENRYSGIPTIRSELKNASLPDPIFSVQHGEFKVIFKNNIYNEVVRYEGKRTKSDIQNQVGNFCKEPKSREELEDFTGYSRFYLMSQIINPLLLSGQLKMTIPDKPKSKNQKYYQA